MRTRKDNTFKRNGVRSNFQTKQKRNGVKRNGVRSNFYIMTLSYEYFLEALYDMQSTPW